VLVTVTSLITGKPSDGELFDRLEKMYFSCGEENVYFSLLCDLMDSKTKVNGNDEEIKAFAVKRMLELRKKYGDIFFLFIRDRSYSKSEGCYMAHERKRGAVNSLCSFLCCKNDGFSNDSIKPDTAVCNRIKYVFTLDSDTNLAFDCVRKALGIMLHPNNKPVFDSEKGRVVKGYAILQPRMMPGATAASKTFFTAFMCSSGGVDSYSSAGYDLMQALLGKGVFCGKGMFHKECFYKTLCAKGGFQKETVLSHDAPEGALLRCLSTRHVTLTDGFPKEQMSYDKRRHRWVRGDIQNFVFFGRHRKNEYGDVIENNVDAYSKYLMFENAADGLLQIFSFVLLMLFLNARDGERIMLVTVALSPYILPFVHTLLSSLRKAFFYNVKRLFYSRRVYSVIWTQLFKMIWDIASVPQSALMCFDAVIRALFRLVISHKHTLEWTTAAQSDAESTDGILGYIKKNLFGAFCGAFFLIASDSAFLDLTALLWMA